jgi:hypothetical protein
MLPLEEQVQRRNEKMEEPNNQPGNLIDTI